MLLESGASFLESWFQSVHDRNKTHFILKGAHDESWHFEIFWTHAKQPLT